MSQKQMINSEAPVVKKIAWDNFTGGFFRRNGDGRIYHGSEWYGKGKLYYVVYENGSICRMPLREPIFGASEVEIISQAALGITEVAWSML